MLKTCFWSGPDPAPCRLNLDTAGVLQCLETVRALEGRRYVLRGLLGERTVFVKLYLDYPRARIHWQRERQGLQALAERGLPGPEWLYAGPGPDGTRVVVLAAIADGQGLDGIEWPWPAPVMPGLMTTMATLHQAGVWQSDPHAGNFLFARGRVFVLDAGGLRMARRALGRRRSLHNLALLLAQFPPLDPPPLLATYAQVRGWSEGPADLGPAIERQRLRRLRRRLDKVVRNSSEFVYAQTFHCLRLWVRAAQGPELERLLQDPDASRHWSGAERLKRGGGSTVWRLDVDGRPRVVKRYNIRGPWHRLRRGLRPSRAWRSWCNAHRLRFYGIPTPAPVALVEERLGPWRGRAWLITEAWPGPDLRQGAGDVTLREQALERLRQLGQAGIVHGDLKDTNLLMGPEGLGLIDLDAMRQPRWAWRYRRGRRRDLARFLNNGRDRPEWLAWFRERLTCLGDL